MNQKSETHTHTLAQTDKQIKNERSHSQTVNIITWACLAKGLKASALVDGLNRPDKRVGPGFGGNLF